MNISPTLWSSLLIFAWIHNCINITFVSSQCLDDQRSLLLGLRSGLEFNHSISTKLVRWNQSTNCCKWSGVHCNNSNGRVIGLDLSNEAISRGIDNLSNMFQLQFLQSLNLAYNPVLGNIPSSLGNLSSLTYLNLSHTDFSGQVPLEISKLINLVILDVSMEAYLPSPNISPLYIRNPKLAVIIQNLTSVRELYLDGISILAERNQWAEVLSSSLPHLQVLSMSGCNLTGGIQHSLAKLGSLSVIMLDFNNLSAPVPKFLARFTNLTMLTLNDCGLTGDFPHEILEVPTLTTLDVEDNQDLQGTLPHSLSKRLKMLTISGCNFQGVIPSSIGSLKQLETLDLSNNNFSGPIPSFSLAENLDFLELSNNSLSGNIPSSIFSIDSKLEFLDLSLNSLEGPVPQSIFQLSNLGVLDLGWNRLNGTLKLHEVLPPLQNLYTLELSHNYLTIDSKGISKNFSLPELGYLGLASSNLHVVPEFIKNQPYLWHLDLSRNQIQGKIPKWIWKDRLYSLNLSRNNFEDLEKHLPAELPNLQILDLHSNKLQGQLPPIPSVTALLYLDFSNNSFFTSINPDFGDSLPSAQFISFARNKIYGSIPESLCSASILQVLDLSYNNLNGTIPVCLIAVMPALVVLNLRENNLHGAIPDEFGKNCTLETLNFNKNALDGQFPGSLDNCKGLQVLDLGNNQLKDIFPCHLKSLSSLRVLVLRSNQFSGSVVCPGSNSFWPLLQIIDIASNRFSGQPSKLLLGKSMMVSTNDNKPEVDSVQYYNDSTIFQYYTDEVTVTFKGFDFQLQKILTIFTSIDLSNNTFDGGIPMELGNLNALKVLNLSHNTFSGNIPQSVGNLSQLESLDLCCNALTGIIPQQLASLSFLGYLNLSFNHLVGPIPAATQLQSFDASSYEGNKGLYGPPLTSRGRNRLNPQKGPPTVPDGSQRRYKSEVVWIFSGAAVGFPLGIIIFFGPLLCMRRLREWYNYHVDRLLMTVLPSKKCQKLKKRSRRSKFENT